jgi:hypothetical protein
VALDSVRVGQRLPVLDRVPARIRAATVKTGQEKRCSDVEPVRHGAPRRFRACLWAREKSLQMGKPEAGLEPATYALQERSRAKQQRTAA